MTPEERLDAILDTLRPHDDFFAGWHAAEDLAALVEAIAQSEEAVPDDQLRRALWRLADRAKSDAQRWQEAWRTIWNHAAYRDDARA